MPGIPRWQASFMICMLIWLPVYNSAKKTSKSSTEPKAKASQLPTPKCKSNDHFDFAPNAPKKNSLSFCKEYASNTCCNRTHSDHISRSIYPYFDDPNNVFTESCRMMAVTVSCSMCDPNVGVGSISGVCESLCDKWYHSCREGMYTSGSYLSPCHHSSLVCFPLKDAVSSGREFCEGSGYTVMSSTHPSTFPFAHLLSAHEVPYDLTNGAASTCFDGTSASLTNRVHSFRTKTDAHHSSGSGKTKREKMEEQQQQELYKLLMSIGLLLLLMMGLLQLGENFVLFKMCAKACCQKDGLTQAQEEKLHMFRLAEELEKVAGEHENETKDDDSGTPEDGNDITDSATEDDNDTDNVNVPDNGDDTANVTASDDDGEKTDNASGNDDKNTDNAASDDDIKS